jgi:hypothetical protein
MSSQGMHEAKFVPTVEVASGAHTWTGGVQMGVWWPRCGAMQRVARTHRPHLRAAQLPKLAFGTWMAEVTVHAALSFEQLQY